MTLEATEQAGLRKKKGATRVPSNTKVSATMSPRQLFTISSVVTSSSEAHTRSSASGPRDESGLELHAVPDRRRSHDSSSARQHSARLWQRANCSGDDSPKRPKLKVEKSPPRLSSAATIASERGGHVCGTWRCEPHLSAIIPAMMSSINRNRSCRTDALPHLLEMRWRSASTNVPYRG
jgi:hypothetical protein